MPRFFCQVLTGLFAAFCFTSDPSGVRADATVALRAVKKNGLSIAPTSNVTGAVVGDVYECEFYISGWGNDPWQVGGYQIGLLGEAGAQSGQVGLVIPVGWDAPVPAMPCDFVSDCTHPEYPICSDGVCTGTEHEPLQGVFVTETRPDFMLYGFCGDPCTGTRSRTLNLLYGAIGADFGGPVDTGMPKYAGTLKLRVMPETCGTFALNIDTSLNYTFLMDPIFNDPYPMIPVPLTIQVTSSCPPDCNGNRRSDRLDIESGESLDCDENLVPDDCQPDLDADSVPDVCDDCSGSGEEPVNACGCPAIGACRIADQGCLTSLDPATCFEVPGQYQGDGSTCAEERLLNDVNADLLVNLADFASFQSCFGRPDAAEDCLVFSGDRCRTINLADFFVFYMAINH